MDITADNIWNVGIDRTIRSVDTKERSEAFITASNGFADGKAYRMLQRAITYSMTHHNGKPLTSLQKDTLAKFRSSIHQKLY